MQNKSNLQPSADPTHTVPDPVPCFAAPRVCLAAAQRESGGKQKHYGCHSVSYSGNTVLQLKYNDNTRRLPSVRSARTHFRSRQAEK